MITYSQIRAEYPYYLAAFCAYLPENDEYLYAHGYKVVSNPTDVTYLVHRCVTAHSKGYRCVVFYTTIDENKGERVMGKIDFTQPIWDSRADTKDDLIRVAKKLLSECDAKNVRYDQHAEAIFMS